jgi:N-methylhydantoinase B
MLDTSVEHNKDVQSVCCGTWDLCVMAGLDQRGNPFATMITDSMGAGFGAGNDHDGVDTAGLLLIPMGKMPDVEMNEFMLPMLYLWRREEPDSGGPGRFRGGVTASLCFVPHDTPVPMMQVVSGSGKSIPMNPGLAGGYPGSSQADIAMRSANVQELFAKGIIPSSLDEITGEQHLLACEDEVLLSPTDVHYMSWQSGGGYGDPLLREPARVAHDVGEFRVTEQSARAVYGVVLAESGEADLAATEEHRRQLKEQRRELAKESR